MAFAKEKFVHVKYYAHGGSGSGASAADPKSISDQDVMAIEPGMLIEEVSVVVSTAVTGSTQLDVGDDDDQNGFVAAATLTAGAVSVGQGAYLANDSSPFNPLAKYYSAAGKEIKLDMTGASTAGAFAVIVKGCKI